VVEGQSIESRDLHGDGDMRLARRNLAYAVRIASTTLSK